MIIYIVYRIYKMGEVYMEANTISSADLKEIENDMKDVDYVSEQFDLRDYLATSNNYPLLSNEETVELCKKAQNKDKDAINLLVMHNLKLVMYVLKKYSWGTTLDKSDLMQEGVIGMLRAIQEFDTTKNIKFSTYAVWWIRQAVTRVQINEGQTIRLPVHIHDNYYKMMKLLSTNKELSVNSDEGIAEVAKLMGLSFSRVKTLASLNINMISLDMPVGDGDSKKKDTRLMDLMPDDVDITESVLDSEIHNEIMGVLNELPARERDVLILRFGLDGGSPKTLQEIADMYGITRERIRQLEAKGLRRIRKSPRLKNKLKV